MRVKDASALEAVKLVWEAPYHYGGYSGGILSDDGEYFVYVDFWYRHEYAAVQIYHRGAYCFFTGKQLELEPDRLQHTASHQLWLDGGPRYSEVSGKPAAVLIPTVQGERRIELHPDIAFHGTACGSP